MTNKLSQSGGWPYPTTKRQVVQLGILLLIIILLIGVGTGAWLWRTSHTPISAEEVTLISDDLASYASEAALLVSSTSGQSLTKNYRTTYADQLHKQINKAEQKLTSRYPSPDTAAAIRQLTTAADRLDRLITTLPDLSDRQAAREYAQQFKRIQQTIQQTEKKV